MTPERESRPGDGAASQSIIDATSTDTNSSTEARCGDCRNAAAASEHLAAQAEAAGDQAAAAKYAANAKVFLADAAWHIANTPYPKGPR